MTLWSALIGAKGVSVPTAGILLATGLTSPLHLGATGSFNKTFTKGLEMDYKD